MTFIQLQGIDGNPVWVYVDRICSITAKPGVTVIDIAGGNPLEVKETDGQVMDLMRKAHGRAA